MSTVWSGRGRGRGRGAPAPAPAVALGGQPPASRSGAATRNGSSPRLNQVQPITAAEGASLSSSTRPVLSSPSPAPGLHNGNYADKFESLRHQFCSYLRANKDCYQKQIHETLGPCKIRVSFQDMIEFNAASSMIRATCGSVKQNNTLAWLIPAAKDFLHDNGCVNEDTGSNEPCISFSGFPESIQNVEEYMQANGPLVQPVPVCGGKPSITALTHHGSIFIEVSIGSILEHHSQGTSWGGTYSRNDIHIIKWRSRSHQRNHGPYTYEMKILQKPVNVIGQSLHEVMARDLRKAAEIFTPLYKLLDDWPAHMLELIEELEGAKQVFVRKTCFIEHLSHHPAIMPSRARITLLKQLNRARSNPLMQDIMQQPPTAYPNGWKTVMQSVIAAEKQADEDDISLLDTLYYTPDNLAGTKYDDTACDLIRFIRNVLVHVKQYPECKLEWYFAKIFSRFLPSIVQTLRK